ncbi:MAG: DUF4058 family protein [Armatimonadetes bacterium]|nr:DUF4058 family protein [Armatimonadota bacterium]
MPSPFPGMDPYLESPALWRDLHHRIITYAADVLTPAVRPQYKVRIEERVYVSEPDRTIYPDFVVVERWLPAASGRREAGAVATIEAADAPTVVRIPVDLIHEGYLEIRDAQSDRVVTVIEVLSPTNKAPGTGRALYLEKQRQVLRSDANLVDVDLLRGGEHTVAAPVQALFQVQPFHYLVSVSRGPERQEYEAYPATVRERLPRIRVPLKPGAADVPLDLTALVARAYENAAYADTLDYAQDPDPPFEGEDAEWVRATARRAAAPPAAPAASPEPA